MASEISAILRQLRHVPQSASDGTPKVIFENLEKCVLTAEKMVSGAVNQPPDPIPPSRRESTTSVVTDPRIDHWWEIGRREFKAGQYKEAAEFLEAVYQQSESRDPQITGWDDLMAMLVVSHCKVGDFELAETMVMRVLREKVAAEPITLAVEGKVFELADILVSKYCEAERWNDAISVLTKVIELKEQHRVSIHNSQRTLAETYLRMGDNERAKIHCIPIVDPQATRLDDPPRLFHESMLLMVLICWSANKRVEAEGYTALLRGEYKSRTPFHIDADPAYVKTDQLCIMKQEDAIRVALTEVLRDAIPDNEAGEWESRRALLLGNSSQCHRRLFFLQLWVNFGTTHQVRRLLSKWRYSEDVNQTLSQGNTVLIEASIRGRHNMIKLLIEFGANINHANAGGWTALHCAIYYSHLKVAEVLLENGADVEMKTNEGLTPTDIARRTNFRAMQNLLRHGHRRGHRGTSAPTGVETILMRMGPFSTNNQSMIIAGAAPSILASF